MLFVSTWWQRLAGSGGQVGDDEKEDGDDARANVRGKHKPKNPAKPAWAWVSNAVPIPGYRLPEPATCRSLSRKLT